MALFLIYQVDRPHYAVDQVYSTLMRIYPQDSLEILARDPCQRADGGFNQEHIRVIAMPMAEPVNMCFFG